MFLLSTIGDHGFYYMVRGTHDCFQKPNYYPGQNVREVNLCISALKLSRNKKKRHISTVTGMR